MAATAPEDRPTGAARLRVVVLVLVALAFASGFLKLAGRPAPAEFAAPGATGAGRASTGPASSAATAATAATAAPAGPASPASPGLFEQGVLPNPDFVEGHAASLVELRDGRVRAFWMAGNEGSRDAFVATAVWDAAQGGWSAATPVATAASSTRGVWRPVKKVGNPVAWRGADGELLLFHVTVSVGGWAGSSISLLRSTDDGRSWSPARRLVTTPFLNVSTMVRNAPFAYADGSIGLPVYQEFRNKRSELLRLDRDGRVLDKQWLSHTVVAVQPEVLVQGPREALVLMRNNDSDIARRQVYESRTTDAGAHWSAPVAGPLPNPGAPVSGVVLDGGILLAALNLTYENRRTMSLVASKDGGRSWRTLQTLDDESHWPAQALTRDAFPATMRTLAPRMGVAPERIDAFARAATDAKCWPGGGCDFEIAYPFLLQARHGDFFLVYTWNRIFIRSVRFDRAWLDARLAQAFDGSAR